MSVVVTEHRAEVVENEWGHQYVAEFPRDVPKAAQYGDATKALSVYMSAFQLIPLDRVRDLFNDQLGLAISKGTISNFNGYADDMLEQTGFVDWAEGKLLASECLHADETGTNVNGSNHWIHVLSDGMVTLYHADKKRGKKGMDRMGVLPHYKGILCHDGWPSYWMYKECEHALCNAHHGRELEFAHEHDGQKWALELRDFLERTNERVKGTGKGCLGEEEAQELETEYLAILSGGRKECPEPEREKGQKGRVKKPKPLNLLNRLTDHKDATLKFMTSPHVPFTNNIAEWDVRVHKMYQNISKCFRTLEGAKRFCRLRSFLITARHHGMSPTDAVYCLFRGEMPFFMRE